MRTAPKDIQPWPLRGADDILAHTAPAFLKLSYFVSSIHGQSLLPGLAFLLAQYFAHIANALLLIHIRRLDRAQVRCDLSDEPFINPFDVDDGLLIHLHVDADRDLICHRIDIPDVKAHGPALKLSF